MTHIPSSKKDGEQDEPPLIVTRIVPASLLIGFSLFFKLCFSIIQLDICTGTGHGGYQSLRICQQNGWVFVPIGIDVLVLVALLIAITISRRFQRYGMWIVIGYVIYAFFSSCLVWQLPFFMERVE
jgi:hypothetical protein